MEQLWQIILFSLSSLVLSQYFAIKILVNVFLQHFYTETVLLQNIISEHIQNFWLQWTSDAFPDLLHCAHFNPSFFVKSVSGIKQSSFLQKKAEIVSSVTSQHHFSRPSLIRDNEVRGDKAMQKVLYSLQKMSEQRREVLFAVGQLPFRRYLGETCYSVAAQYLDFFYSLREYQHLKWKGDFDVIILHPLYGLVVCGVVVYADKVTTPDISTQDTASKIRSKLEEAVSQLNNAEEVLLFLVSDIIPDLRIRKTIAFPNLSADQIQSALTGDTQLIRVKQNFLTIYKLALIHVLKQFVHILHKYILLRRMWTEIHVYAKHGRRCRLFGKWLHMPRCK